MSEFLSRVFKQRNVYILQSRDKHAAESRRYQSPLGGREWRTMWLSVGVTIMPKKDVLDVQGRAIATTLQQQGYVVEDCQYGKFLKLKIQARSKEEALQKVRKMVDLVLCNSLVEQYEVAILPS